MIARFNAPCFVPGLEQLQARFLTILPRIERHARIYFRQVVCPGRRTDFIAETQAIAWRWFLMLAQQGKDATTFPSVLATFAARAAKSGRRVCGHEKAKDAMSAVAQQRHEFHVGKLPDCSTLSTNPLNEALIDNTRSTIPDQVQFRCDFPSWVRTHSRRHRRLIHEMALGERTKTLARRFKMSEGRISQLRRQFHEGWDTFCGETLDYQPASAVRDAGPAQP